MTSRGTKVTVLTWVKNEEHILPFFLRHYAFADEIIVWDNESTDLSRRILHADSRVRVNEWVTGGELRDDELIRMKNEEYRKTGPGWKIIVDADEFVYHPDILMLLDMYDDVGVTIAQTVGFDMVSRVVPADDGKSLLTDLVKEGVQNDLYSKCCVIRDTCVISYLMGAHKPKTVGGKAVASDRAHVRLLHYRYLSRELVMDKASRIKLSDQNRRCQVGINQASPEKMRKKWEDTWRRRFRVL